MEEKAIKKVGRPELLQPKSKQIKGSFTEQEYGIIKIKSDALGISPGQFVSKMALSGKISEVYSPEQKVRIRKLIGMTNNLNQLAKIANTVGLNSIVLEVDEIIKDIRIVINQGR